MWIASDMSAGRGSLVGGGSLVLIVMTVPRIGSGRTVGLRASSRRGRNQSSLVFAITYGPISCPRTDHIHEFEQGALVPVKTNGLDFLVRIKLNDVNLNPRWK